VAICFVSGISIPLSSAIFKALSSMFLPSNMRSLSYIMVICKGRSASAAVIAAVFLIALGRMIFLGGNI